MGIKKRILCIAGDRNCLDYKILKAALVKFNIDLSTIGEIVSGKCKGADELGEILAKENKIKIKEFPAKWDDLTAKDALIRTNKFGKEYDAKAGFRRNKEMAEYADELLCLEPFGPSNGSQDTIEHFKKLGKPVNVYYGDNEPKARKKYAF